MRFLNRIQPASAAAGGLIVGLAVALAMPALAQLSSMNTFQSGETASATEVNENFDALVQAVNDLEQQVDTLQAEVDAHEALLDLQDFVVDLDQFLEIHLSQAPEDTAVEAPIIRVTGANLQIVNAAGEQTTPDGTGNLVVGFAEARGMGDTICSDGSIDDETDCTNAGEVWSQAHNTGSHNIVGGESPAYSRTSGFVVGRTNAINRLGASVTAGESNIASGVRSSVSGGWYNTASGWRSSVSGGWSNTASENQSSVSGGTGNEASGTASAVSGGVLNDASGAGSSVSGGRDCELTAQNAWGAQDADGTGAGDC